MGTNSLDNLASNGIINFDADAFVKGTPPRYAGSPEQQLYLPFDKPLMSTPDEGNKHNIKPGEKLSGEPEQDAFISKGHEYKPMNWRGWLMAGIVGSVVLYTASKLGKISDGAKNATEKAKGFFGTCKDKVTSLFKPKEAKEASKEAAKEAPKETKAAETTIEKAKSKLVSLFDKMPKWGKPVAIGAAALLGLYGLYQVVKPKPHAPEQPNPIQPTAHE